MSFSGQSNPPWQRNSMNNSMQGSMHNVGSEQIPMSSSNSGMAYHQNSQMFMNQQTSQQNQNMQYNQMGASSMNPMPGNQVFPQGVAYPSRTGLNPVAFQNTGSGSGQNQQNNMGMHNQTRQNYNSMGTVTKISNDCGLVNDKVLFYKNICKGVVPKVGDRVLFESNYSPNNQFKWNATRVQLVSQASPQVPPPPLMSQNIKSSGYNAVPPPNEYRASNSQRRSPPSGGRRASPGSDRHSNRDRKESNRGRDRGDRNDFEADRKRRREDSPRNRERDRREPERREISLDKKDRERSPARRQSPKRRKNRPIPRYVVQIPKTLLTFKSGGVQEIKRRYSNLYIPSDFFHTQVKWSETFTPDNPFSMRRPCSFHITHKVVEPLRELKSISEPEDVDYIFSAKVMLLGCPPISEIYSKCFNQDENDDSHKCIHPSRLINFLVGTRARNEPMAIGGPWSPSLDGENPDKDPAVLIRTAIRNCLMLTGIDLSNCTQWYRFVELYYHRADYTSKGKIIPSRVETVVIYLPDIHSCMPTRSEWDTLGAEYKTAAANHLNRIQTAAAEQSSGEAVAGQPEEKASQSAAERGDADTVPDSATSLANLGGEDGDKQSDEIGHEKDEIKKEPTHYSKLDLKTMKIQDIRDELIARSLSSKGLKPQVSARLSKALAMEKEKDNEREDEDSKKDEDVTDDTDLKDDDDNGDAGIEVDMSDIVILDEYDSSKNMDADNTEKDQTKELDEKERKQLERRYLLPEEQHIIVHPSKTAKDGKFDCTVMSLSVLLDYRPEDTKERFFEVSLFAELFNEMLMRDFGFNIFKELHFFKEPVTEKEETKKDENRPASNNDDDDKSKDGSNPEQSSAEKKPPSDNDKRDKNQRDRRLPKRHLEDDAEDDCYSVHSSDRKKKSDKKMFVAKPQLLLSFIYFDTTHCGYIFEKDLEELFAILGLGLSRAEIRKSLSKSVSRHALYYRKLTDAEEKAENLVKENEDDEDVPIEELRKIAMGNTTLLPVFKTDNGESGDNTALIKSSGDADGMVTYNGISMHVGKLFEQNKRYEKSYSELEHLYNDLKKQNTDLQANYTKASGKAKDLQSEVKSLLRKLSDADQDLFTLNRKYNDQHSALAYCYDKISPFVARSEKNHKSSDGSRDRDNTKDKDKKDEKEKKEEKEKKDDKEKKEEKDKEKSDDKPDKEKAKEKVDNEKDVKPEIKKESE